MWHNGRRVLVAPWAHAREMFATVTAERDWLKQELAEVRHDRDELRARLVELLDAVRNRRAAEAELRALYRERDIYRAQQTQRGDATTVH